MNLRARLVPYLLLGVLTLGAGLGIGLGLSEAPVSSPFRSATQTPSPRQLTNVVVFDFNGIGLSPPPANVKPPVSPAEAWKAAHAVGASTYRLVLAQWSSTVPLGPSGLTRALVWLVFGTHVSVPNTGPPSSAKHPGVVFEEGMWPVDATTGQTFGTYGFPSKEVADLAKELRPV
jgi:hypothetical protein